MALLIAPGHRSVGGVAACWGWLVCCWVSSVVCLLVGWLVVTCFLVTCLVGWLVGWLTPWLLHQHHGVSQYGLVPHTPLETKMHMIRRGKLVRYECSWILWFDYKSSKDLGSDALTILWLMGLMPGLQAFTTCHARPFMLFWFGVSHLSSNLSLLRVVVACRNQQTLV